MALPNVQNAHFSRGIRPPPPILIGGRRGWRCEKMLLSRAGNVVVRKAALPKENPMGRKWWALIFVVATNPFARAEDLGEEGFVDSQGVRIHYVTLGKGPLIVLIHGFPDFWYSWRDQMPALAKHFQVVAIDQRGYNKSDQPKAVESYTVDKLVQDVEAVLKHVKQDKAVIVGHDWGGLVAWTFAMTHPEGWPFRSPGRPRAGHSHDGPMVNGRKIAH